MTKQPHLAEQPIFGSFNGENSDNELPNHPKCTRRDSQKPSRSHWELRHTGGRWHFQQIKKPRRFTTEALTPIRLLRWMRQRNSSQPEEIRPAQLSQPPQSNSNLPELPYISLIFLLRQKILAALSIEILRG